MTKRKPLAWCDVEPDLGVGVDGRIPQCMKCCDLLLMPMFAEAVCSVAIEHPMAAADLAKRTLESYHQRRHPAAEWGLGATE